MHAVDTHHEALPASGDVIHALDTHHEASPAVDLRRVACARQMQSEMDRELADLISSKQVDIEEIMGPGESDDVSGLIFKQDEAYNRSEALDSLKLEKKKEVDATEGFIYPWHLLEPHGGEDEIRIALRIRDGRRFVELCTPQSRLGEFFGVCCSAFASPLHHGRLCD